jgi:hypothetical protein
MNRRIPAVAATVVAVAAVLLAGCGGTGPGTGSGSGRQDPNAAPDDLTREIACFRAHGLPNFPDPVYDPNDGRWHLAGNRPALTTEVRQACAAVLPQATPASPVPTAQFRDLLDYAKCMRANGVPSWPDPGVDGVFVTTINPKADPDVAAAAPACEKYLASSGGNLSIRLPGD